jgi:hypothetical protein
VQIKSTTATNSAILKIENNSTAYIGNESSSVNSLFLGTTAYATCLGNVGAYPVQLATNNNVRMTIDTSGNVGIGTASPIRKLSVEGGGLGFQDAGGSASRAISWIDSTTSNSPLQILGNSTTGNCFLSFLTNAFGSAATERLRIDSSGNVGIGTTSADSILHIKGSVAVLTVEGTATSSASVQFKTNTLNRYKIATPDSSADLAFYSSGTTERLRIDSSGNLLVGKTSPSTSTVGLQFTPSDNKVACGAANGPSAFFNRNTDDGIIVQIAQDGTVEGTISVSGTTVSYNGGHLSRFSQLPSGQRDPAIKKGTVLSNLDAMCEWRDADGNLLPNEQLNKVKISDVEGDSNTAGVFVNWDNDDQDNPYDLNMAMTGDMIIRIAQGTSVNRGDLLISAGDGTAKPQGDDIIRSKTIAKVTSTNVTCTYEDGSYCVPCVLMAC